MTLNDFLFSEYADGGRGARFKGFRQYDCWGLVRAIRHEIYGKALMPSYGHVCPANKREITDAWVHAETLLEPCQPSPSAIACVFHGKVLLHVGVVVIGDRGLSVAEITPEAGPRVLTIKEFERQYNKNNTDVRYYNDKNLP